MANLNAPWRQPPAPIPQEQIKAVYEADVVVVGCAHAGTAAARAAAEEGAKVIVIDKQREKSFHAVGNDLGHVNSQFLASKGIPHVDEIEFMNDWQLRSNNRSNPKLVLQFARNGGFFDWMIEPLSEEQKEDIYTVYWPGPKNFKGTLQGFHFYPGCCRFSGKTSLSKVAKLNHEIAKEHGAQFLWETTGEQLVKTGNRVTGVIAKQKDGTYIQLSAKKGVILAAGDFSKNAEMVEDLCDEIYTLKDPNQVVQASVRGQDGSGIRMGVWAGGRMAPGPIATMGANYFFPNQVIGTTATLWLDRDGNRFCNEGFGDVVLSGVEGARLPDGYVTSVFDSDIEEWFSYQAPGHNAVWPEDESDLGQIRFLMKTARESGKEGCILNLHAPRDPKAKSTRSGPGDDFPMGGPEGMPGGMPPMGPPTEPNEVGPLGRGRAREQAEFTAFAGNGDARTLRGRGGPGGMPGGPGGMPPMGGPDGPGGMPGGPGGMPPREGELPGGPFGPGGPRQDPQEKMYCADTLEELADYLGFTGDKKENFLNAVARYNKFCEQGLDEDFGKDPQVLLPIKSAPYYAFKRHSQIGNEFLATVDGLWTDDKQNVLDMNKEPIPGLYATGNCCGRRWGIQYSTPISGVSIGMAWGLGRLCGINAANAE